MSPYLDAEIINLAKSRTAIFAYPNGYLSFEYGTSWVTVTSPIGGTMRLLFINEKYWLGYAYNSAVETGIYLSVNEGSTWQFIDSTYTINSGTIAGAFVNDSAILLITDNYEQDSAGYIYQIVHTDNL